MKYLKFIAKKNSWFLEGTEALPETCFGCGRITPDQLEEFREENGMGMFFLGIHKIDRGDTVEIFLGYGMIGNEIIDSEFECYDMFDIQETEEFIGITNDGKIDYTEEVNKFFKFYL